ncbi:MAG: hypothetical protein Q7J72_08925 [Candidatus Omnitrophota bacterium]|nr:hypothetical protein [Candidatus Omnitrophota bacterium]
MKKKLKIAMDVWRMTFGLFKQNPNVLIPFLLVGLVDVVLLFMIYLAPQPPLSALLGPPIRVFWGERFLHYPFNLLLIPQLFDIARIFSTALMGVLMTGAAVRMLKEAHSGIKPDIVLGLSNSLRVYLKLLVIWLVMFGLVSVVFKALPAIFHFKQHIASQMVLGACFLISILIQALFIYAIPAVIIEEKKIWPAIKRSVSFCQSAFLPTLILVGLPTLVYIPMVILKGKLPFLMSKTFPELVVVFVGLGIVISVIMDCLITSSTTVLFLNKRKDE